MRESKNSLYDIYHEMVTDCEKWLYYKHANCYIDMETIFLPSKSQNFLHEYFTAGGKLEAFKWIEQDENFKMTDFRANHTVSAFLIGIVLRDELHMSMKALPNIESKDRDNFLYFWSLTCLYHDISFQIEKNSLEYISKCDNLNDFYRLFKIEYKLVNDMKDNEQSKLIKNYFKFRLSQQTIDHGISGALLLYDALMKNYHEAMNTKKIKANTTFEYNGLRFSREHKDGVRKISETIARHNMWLANPLSIQEYKKYNLDILIPNEKKSCIISFGDEHNLLFLLGLIDSIEPIKCLAEESNFDSYSVLKNLNITFSYKKFEIEVNSSAEIIDKYFNRIKGIISWLDIELFKDDTTLKIKINKHEKQRTD